MEPFLLANSLPSFADIFPLLRTVLMFAGGFVTLGISNAVGDILDADMIGFVTFAKLQLTEVS